MIYDKLTNLFLYKGICPNLDTALDFLAKTDLNALPLGKTVVDGDRVFVNVMEAQAAPPETKTYEIHKKYMDIQIDLIGTELIRVGDLADMKVLDFNPETDFGRADCPELSSCTMGPGNFIVCMTEEPHMPGIASGSDTFLKKCVVKVQWQKGTE